MKRLDSVKARLCVTALSFTLLTGCTDPSMLSSLVASGGKNAAGSVAQEANGAVSVSIRGLAGNRQLLATLSDIDSISVSVQDSLKTHSKSLGKAALVEGEASASFTGLMPGEAAVTAEVFDVNGVRIGSGSITVTIEARKNTTATIPIQLVPTIVDAGNLNSEIVITDGEVQVVNQVPPLHFVGGSYSDDAPPATSGDISTAPKIAGLTLSQTPVLTALSGTFSFQDAPSGAKDVLVQIQGTPGHFVFPLPSGAISSGIVDLSYIGLPADFAHGERLMSFALRDNAGNVSPYLTGKVTVGEAQAIEVSQVGPLKIIGAIPSQSTSYYQQTNGTDPIYQMTTVAAVDFEVDRGNFNHLYLAGDAAGTLPLGWDNALVVEYRATKDGPIVKRWVYGDASPAGVNDLVQGPAPTVSGYQVGIPNINPFGWEPNALDLMSMIPDAPRKFHLRFVFFDFGAVGSTTDVWMVPGNSNNQ